MSSSSFADFVAELKRRRVFRVAIAYAVVAWVAIEVADTIFPRLGLPEWTVTLVVGLVLVCAPVAIVLAWAFELSPAGVRRTEPSEAAAASSSAARARGPAYVGLGILIALVGFGAYAYLGGPARSDPAGIERSIAVLPFENLSDDPQNEYFSIGITDDILTKLAAIADLQVVSRTSVMQYGEIAKPVREIAAELGVGLILEGTVQRAGGRVRITAQLIDARTDRHLWADTYERGLTDVFAIQDEIAREIADALRIRLTTGDEHRLARPSTGNIDAYDLYLRGRFFWNKRTGEDIATAIDYFRRAIEEDPTYALAWSGLAEAYAVPSTPLPPPEALPRAIEAARRALALDSTLAQAQTAFAYATMLHEQDWDAAELAFRRAMELDPGYATAHQWYAEYLATHRRMDEAIASVRRAEELDPLSSIIAWNVGRILYFARRYDEAVAQFEKGLAVYGESGRFRNSLAQTHLERGDADATIEQFAYITPPQVIAELRAAAATDGTRGIVRAMLQAFGRAPEAGEAVPRSGMVARLSAMLGDADRAMPLLEELRELRVFSAEITDLSVSPAYDPIRSDPRFVALLDSLGLPT